MQFFQGMEPLKYEGPSSSNDMAFRHYNPTEMLGDKTLAEHLRFAVCYWHNFVWEGSDVFGQSSFPRAWNALADSNPMTAAKAKTDAAFELFQILGVPFYCFHDIDARPEGSTFAESDRNLSEMVDYMHGKQEETGMELLWGTANLFSHPRFMAGAAVQRYHPYVSSYFQSIFSSLLSVPASSSSSSSFLPTCLIIFFAVFFWSIFIR